MSLVGTIIRKILEREARKYPLEEWPSLLSKGESKVAGPMEAGAATTKNQEVARHIIGIERWSQSRLRVFLGGELVMDEYDPYEPASDLDLPALAETFVETRQDTVKLAEEIVAANVPPERKVAHNDLGDMDARTWFAYISGHSLRESGRIKP